METNIGAYDRLARFMAGLIILAFGMDQQSLLALIGIIPLVSALSGVCPLYAIFNIRTGETSQIRIRRPGRLTDDGGYP